MNAIFKREVKAYFNTIIGYIFISVFMMFASYFFLFVNIVYLSVDIRYLFISMTLILAFLIPVLTMRSLAEERRSKTDQILLTSPVRVSDIILGKYLAALYVFLISVACTLIFLFLLFGYGKPDPGLIAAVYAGFALFGAALIAIGIFLSSLTENQVIAALSTFGALLFVQLFDSLKGVFNNPQISKVITWLSLGGRFREFTIGVFNFEHIIYYISFIAVMLFLTVRVVEKRRYS